MYDSTTPTAVQIDCDSNSKDISNIYELRSSGFDLGAGTQRIVGANVQQKSKEIKLLLHADTENGSNNIVDSSRVHHNINDNGNVSIGTSSIAPINPNFGYIDFDGSGDYLSTSDETDDWQIGSGSESPFTVDFWANFNNDSSSSSRTFLQLDGLGTTSNDFLVMSYVPSTKVVSVKTPNGTCTYNDTSWYSSSDWIHFAVVRDKNQKTNLYIKGKKQTPSGSCDYPSGTFSLEKIYIGSDNIPSNYFYGYIDEFRFYAGEYFTTEFEDNCPVDANNDDDCKPY